VSQMGYRLLSSKELYLAPYAVAGTTRAAVALSASRATKSTCSHHGNLENQVTRLARGRGKGSA
jgi:hypothetical protein